jgi:hypothetical protein
MGTREDAGDPGALGRVWTARRVGLGGLWLAVRALTARAGLTLALIALTAFAVGVAAAGAMYLRAAGESLLQDRLAATSPFSAGLLVERKVASSTEYAVVGPTGLVQLPAHALEVLPPGARALVEVGDGPVLLHPVEPPDET